MIEPHPFERYCSICKVCDGPLVRAAYVARAPDGTEWFECEACSKLGEDESKVMPVSLTPIGEWFAARGLPVPN